MSRKTELAADLKRVGYQLAGSHLTRQARDATFRTFAATMRTLNFGIEHADQIGGRHLDAYFVQRATDGAGNRTRANEASHLRAVLRAIGKQGLANNPKYSNQALGIGRSSRIGTKTAIGDAAVSAFRERMDSTGRTGLGITLQMQQLFGLREAEAIRAGNAETLVRWARELREQGAVRVIEGTKGGRPRTTHLVQVERASALVQSALALLQSTGQRYLVTRADGSAAANLKQAMNIYRNVCHREGIQTHGARYAFARERLETYKARGLSEREARAATSLDLGHGDGRGRYVASVYAQVQ